MERKDAIKILYTIPNFDTAGSGKALLNIASRLPTDFKPMICCMHDRGEFFEVVKSSGIPVHLSQYTADMSRRLKGIRQVFKISRFFRSIKPDIIHSFHYAPDYSEPLAARMAGVKWIYTKKNMNWGGKSANGWKLRSYLANRIIAQNLDMMDKFFSKSSKVSQIPRGVDVQQFYPREPDEELRKEFSLTRDNFVIVCVANLVPVKGIETLIKSVSRVYLENSFVRLLVVGDNRNEYGQTLEAMVQDMELVNHIFFTGKRSDVGRFLSIANLVVLPTLSKGEGSPVAVLEAMASSIPVYASNIPGVRDQLKSFPHRMFEPGNDYQLAEMMNYAMRNPALEKVEGKKLMDFVRSEHTIEREVQRHISVYYDCLGGALNVY